MSPIKFLFSACIESSTNEETTERAVSLAPINQYAFTS
eukprot:CAMPEP_0201283578 /NCGR_PEP_ID=MMETSP1317-20130820/23563_1 /ASSEMBLY_ACC=CAM_ASM_000770 /TAXON_ID=187299 /ORGANISM="Undescribed Undescribed, Strain Undescribed" /LENGTH=37 /DNA_ID= /DNA_START= /DNA_END= /DNA_ORIENTATION=